MFASWYFVVCSITKDKKSEKPVILHWDEIGWDCIWWTYVAGTAFQHMARDTGRCNLHQDLYTPLHCYKAGWHSHSHLKTKDNNSLHYSQILWTNCSERSSLKHNNREKTINSDLQYCEWPLGGKEGICHCMCPAARVMLPALHRVAVLHSMKDEINPQHISLFSFTLNWPLYLYYMQ